uniref:Ninjurin-2-like n=1 Tax=Hirondellea gigas TaxID=1518452 RepID=A0A2P2I558_9CRUS
MSEQLFAPSSYRVPGVTYVKNGQTFTHYRQSTPHNMSVRPMDNNEGPPRVSLEMANRIRESDNSRPTQGRKPLNPNTYATRKTVAQGMLDIALLTANASQLRYVLSLGDRHEYYGLMIGLISTSLVLQVLLGIMILVIGALNINKLDQQVAASILNNVITALTIVLTVINVALNSFGMTHNIEQGYTDMSLIAG